MILTVSRQVGSDGEAIARSIAASQGLAVVDRDTIRAAAMEAGIPADLLQRLMYVGHRNVADDIIQPLGHVAPDVAVTASGNPLLGVYAPSVSMDTINLQDAAKAIGQIIKSIAARDNVLIIGQGGQALLAGHPAACHVLFVAPLELRVTNIAQWYSLSLREARRRVRGTDQSRGDYLARYHNIRWLDPLLYHVVINTGLVTIEDATALVIRALDGVARAAAGRLKDV